MKNPLNWLKGALFVSLTILALVVSMAVVDVNTRLSVTFGKLDNEIDEMHRLTLEAGLTASEARKASIKESAYLDQWNSQIAKFMGDAQAVMIQTRQTVASIQDVSQAATDTLQTTQVTIQALQAPITQANADLAALEPFIAHSDALVTNPAIPATLANVQSTTGHLDATAKDVQETVHSYTHPTWAHKIFAWTLDIAHALNPL